MNKVEAAELIREIKGAYGSRFEVNEHTAPTWHKYFEKEKKELVFEALSNHIKNDAFAPTINQLSESLRILKQKENARDNSEPARYEPLF
jgi:hypothetical protein